jgi:hypothetical protein
MTMESDEADDSGPAYITPNKTSDGLRFELVRSYGDRGHIQFNEADFARVASEFGSPDLDYLFPLLRRIGMLGTKPGFWDSDIVKFSIAFIRGIRPRDPIGGLLGFHMMNVHEILRVNYDRINNSRFCEYNEQEENADRALNRAMRTFVQLTEAFDRHQNGGEQKLTVRHTAVANGQSKAKASKRSKRGTFNGDQVINGTANHVEVDDKVLLNKSANGE